MVTLINDIVIEAKVLEQEEAKEKYDDAVAGGHSAVMLEENKVDQDVFKMNIGNILPR